MRLEQLKYLIAIEQFGSLSAASQALYLTTPTLSLSIKSMENELGFTLLERTSKGVHLTASAQKLVALSSDFFLGLDELITHEKSTAQPLYLPIKGLALHEVIRTFLPKVITSFYQKFNDYRIIIDQITYQDLCSELLSEDCSAEFGLSYICQYNGHDLCSLHKKLQFQPLIRQEYVCLAAPTFPGLVDMKNLSLKKLLSYPLILFENSDSRNYTSVLLGQFGHSESFIFEKNYSIYLELIRSGIGVSLALAPALKSAAAIHSNDFISIPLSDDAYVDFGILTTVKPRSPATEQFLIFLKQYLHIYGVHPLI